jgi:glycosyltransferase involved in cell wall biosynthesis
MRILLLNQYYLPDAASTGQHLADVARALAARGHEVHVVCSRRGYGGGSTAYAPEETLDGVLVHRLEAAGFGRSRTAGRLADYASFYALAWRRALALPPMDVCVALTTPPFVGTVAAGVARRRAARLVLWMMDLYPEVAAAFGVLRRGGAVHRGLARLARSLYRRADQIISLGPYMTRRLIAAGAMAERIVEVDIWVPAEAVRPLPPEQSRARRRWAPDAGTVMMYSGNLGLGHQLETAVEALDRLRGEAGAAGRDLRVVFVGEGKLKPRIQGMVAERGLDRVQFHPPQPLADLSDSLAAGDFHLVAQRAGTEGLLVPGKLFGVMAAGRATLFVGPEECEVGAILRESQAGIIVPPDDVPAAADAIRMLCEEPRLRADIGRRARAFYEQRLGLKRNVSGVVAAVEGESG